MQNLRTKICKLNFFEYLIYLGKIRDVQAAIMALQKAERELASARKAAREKAKAARDLV